MPPSPSPIRNVSIEAFRGFREAMSLDIDASAVILTGPNGTGKTSFFDAIQWALTGKLERLEELRSRRNVEHVVNRWRHGEPAIVELELVIGEAEYRLRRSGDYRDSTLELSGDQLGSLFGGEAERHLRHVLEPGTDLPLDVALAATGILQQDVMRAVLQAKPADRYRHVSMLLGLGDLEDFEDAVKRAVASSTESLQAVERDRNRAQGALDATRERLERSREQLRLRVPAETSRRAVE